MYCITFMITITFLFFFLSFHLFTDSLAKGRLAYWGEELQLASAVLKRNFFELRKVYQDGGIAISDFSKKYYYLFR